MSASHLPGSDMASLILRFDAPMQSWGTSSRFERRDTAREPTKSGVVGLLAAARGNSREDNDAIAELAKLRMGVRVDREGDVDRDFQTIGNVPSTKGVDRRTALSDRYFLSGALFLTVVEGSASLIESLYEALRHPRWQLYLGRKAFVPALPLVAPDAGSAIQRIPLEEVLATHVWLEVRRHVRLQAEVTLEAGKPQHLRTITDSIPALPDAELRHDHPVSFAHHARSHAPRAVRVGHVPVTASLLRTSVPATADAHTTGTDPA